MSQPDEGRPLADRRGGGEEYEEPDIAGEFAPSPTDPAGQPGDDPDDRVYGQDEGYEKPTEV
ncbi:hypothetical protein [Planomonospora venezuelensis]|uniref:Uncharacterized protein n=1 Tax=Planomonospora venezuelensis TaxID=1999 RepID=A0A841CW86_PLAVE|nr:hypothetical protein [Planomonospora venezuelensis]MBB5961569.1 hypothetical protein [Planomonospora venezuelensis]GIM98715.1 hypothetical protein Pve01_03740 [Planomonospora venezuelensis]